MRETNKTLEWEQEILKGISNRYPEAKVEIKHVVKLGETKKAIIIMEKDINVYPTIYFDDFEAFCDRLKDADDALIICSIMSLIFNFI